MTLEFIDGFDHYTSSVECLRKYDVGTVMGTISASYGRFGTNGMVTTGSKVLVKNLSNQVTRVVGLAASQVTIQNGYGLVRFNDGATTQVGFELDDLGRIRIWRGSNSTVLALSTNSLTTGIWHYIECKATINDTTGFAEVKVDGVSWASFTGKTNQSANLYSNSIQVGLASSFWLDDLYILNGVSSGTPPNNDYLGDVKVETKMPTGDGANHAWSRSAGAAQYSQVDEVPCTDDTDYNYSSTPGQIDTFTHGNLITAAGTIFGVQTCLTARKDDVGSRVLRDYMLSGVTPDESSDDTLSTSYQMFRKIREHDPNANGGLDPWTIGTVNALEFGYKEQS